LRVKFSSKGLQQITTDIAQPGCFAALALGPALFEAGPRHMRLFRKPAFNLKIKAGFAKEAHVAYPGRYPKCATANESKTSLMKFTDGETTDNIAQALIDFCNAFFPNTIAENKFDFHITRAKSKKFNARVETSDGIRFLIKINDGVIEVLKNTIDGISADTISDEVEALSSVLLGNKSHQNIIYRSIVYNSIVFILLHEISHITCGHFSYIIEQRQLNNNDINYTFNEIGEFGYGDSLQDQSSLDQHFVKLAELEADIVAFDLMHVLSWELFIKNSEAREISETIHSDNPPDFVREKSSELIFYAACLSLSMIEATRRVHKEYPLPFARIFNIAHTYFSRNLPGKRKEVNDMPGTATVVLDDNTREICKKSVTAFINAVDIAENCCHQVGFHLNKLFSQEEHDDAFVARLLSSDFTTIMINLDPSEVKTQEALQYIKLRSLLASFNQKLAPYRVKLSYR